MYLWSVFLLFAAYNGGLGSYHVREGATIEQPNSCREETNTWKSKIRRLLKNISLVKAGSFTWAKKIGSKIDRV